MEELLELDPNHALFRAMLANALDEFGKSDVAEKEFKKSVELDPTSEITSLSSMTSTSSTSLIYSVSRLNEVQI
ncbi:MAG TPA: hypothetical protein EYP59_06585, partial [Thiotrichaceae bacterium]|nr:hypothetical protein [Thiotrichaceae bacterium]